MAPRTRSMGQNATPKAAPMRIRKKKGRKAAKNVHVRAASGAEDPTPPTPAKSSTSSTRTANRTPKKRSEEEIELSQWLDITGRIVALPEASNELGCIIRKRFEKKLKLKSQAASIHLGTVRGPVLCTRVDTHAVARDIVAQANGVLKSRISEDEGSTGFEVCVHFTDDVTAARAYKRPIILPGRIMIDWAYPIAGNRNFVSDHSRILEFKHFSPAMKEDDIRILFGYFSTEKIDVTANGAAIVKFTTMHDDDTAGEFMNGFCLFGSIIFCTQALSLYNSLLADNSLLVLFFHLDFTLPFSTVSIDSSTRFSHLRPTGLLSCISPGYQRYFILPKPTPNSKEIVCFGPVLVCYYALSSSNGAQMVDANFGFQIVGSWVPMIFTTAAPFTRVICDSKSYGTLLRRYAIDIYCFLLLHSPLWAVPSPSLQSSSNHSMVYSLLKLTFH